MLNHKVSVYVPGTNGLHDLSDNSKHIEATIKAFALKFGGASAVAAEGAWVAEDGSLVREPVTIVYSYTEDCDENVREFARIIAEGLKTDLKQEAVSVEIDNTLEFV